MKKDERELLAKEKIKEDLRLDYKKELVATAVCAPIALLCLLGSVWMLFAASGSLDTGVLVFLFVVASVVLLISLLFLVLSFYNLISARACIKRERFYVDTEELVRISKDEIVRPSLSIDYLMRNLGSRGGPYIETAFYFEKHGRFAVTKTLSDYSRHGDKFYLVVSKGKKEKILKLYSLRIYRMEE